MSQMSSGSTALLTSTLNQMRPGLAAGGSTAGPTPSPPPAAPTASPGAPLVRRVLAQPGLFRAGNPGAPLASGTSGKLGG